ncbi:unnamed protein product [Amoebophrya sp. A25]|nr:unnamed protein product [Amoebophrya sp. A25]|eukprot:GSA25T00025634001.1
MHVSTVLRRSRRFCRKGNRHGLRLREDGIRSIPWPFDCFGLDDGTDCGFRCGCQGIRQLSAVGAIANCGNHVCAKVRGKKCRRCFAYVARTRIFSHSPSCSQGLLLRVPQLVPQPAPVAPVVAPAIAPVVADGIATTIKSVALLNGQQSQALVENSSLLQLPGAPHLHHAASKMTRTLANLIYNPGGASFEGDSNDGPFFEQHMMGHASPIENTIFDGGGVHDQHGHLLHDLHLRRGHHHGAHSHSLLATNLFEGSRAISGHQDLPNASMSLAGAWNLLRHLFDNAAIDPLALVFWFVVTSTVSLGIDFSKGANHAGALCKFGALGLFVIFAAIMSYVGTAYEQGLLSLPEKFAKTWLSEPARYFMPHGFGGVLEGAGILMFAYVGFESLGQLNEETAGDPVRQLPIAMLLTVAGSFAVYFSVALCILSMIHAKSFDSQMGVVTNSGNTTSATSSSGSTSAKNVNPGIPLGGVASGSSSSRSMSIAGNGTNSTNSTNSPNGTANSTTLSPIFNGTSSSNTTSNTSTTTNAATDASSNSSASSAAPNATTALVGTTAAPVTAVSSVASTSTTASASSLFLLGVDRDSESEGRNSKVLESLAVRSNSLRSSTSAGLGLGGNANSLSSSTTSLSGVSQSANPLLFLSLASSAASSYRRAAFQRIRHARNRRKDFSTTSFVQEKSKSSTVRSARSSKWLPFFSDGNRIVTPQSKTPGAFKVSRGRKKPRLKPKNFYHDSAPVGAAAGPVYSPSKHAFLLAPVKEPQFPSAPATEQDPLFPPLKSIKPFEPDVKQPDYNVGFGPRPQRPGDGNAASEDFLPTADNSAQSRTSSSSVIEQDVAGTSSSANYGSQTSTSSEGPSSTSSWDFKALAASVGAAITQSLVGSSSTPSASSSFSSSSFSSSSVSSIYSPSVLEEPSPAPQSADHFRRRSKTRSMQLSSVDTTGPTTQLSIDHNGEAASLDQGGPSMSIVDALYTGRNATGRNAKSIEKSLKQLKDPTPITAIVRQDSEALSHLISTGACIGIFPLALNALLSSSRMIFRMARDGIFPGFIASINERTQTPTIAIIVIALITSILTLYPYNALAEIMSVNTIIAFVMVCMAVLNTRAHPDFMKIGFGTQGFLESLVGVEKDGKMRKGEKSSAGKTNNSSNRKEQGVEEASSSSSSSNAVPSNEGGVVKDKDQDGDPDNSTTNTTTQQDQTDSARTRTSKSRGATEENKSKAFAESLIRASTNTRHTLVTKPAVWLCGGVQDVDEETGAARSLQDSEAQQLLSSLLKIAHFLFVLLSLAWCNSGTLCSWFLWCILTNLCGVFILVYSSWVDTAEKSRKFQVPWVPVVGLAGVFFNVVMLSRLQKGMMASFIVLSLMALYYFLFVCGASWDELKKHLTASPGKRQAVPAP